MIYPHDKNNAGREKIPPRIFYYHAIFKLKGVHGIKFLVVPILNCQQFGVTAMLNHPAVP